MLFQSPTYQQNKGEGVCFYPVISMNIYLYSLSMFVFYWSVFIYKYMAYFRQWEHRCIIWGILFGKKGILLAHTLLKQLPFLTISNKNIFFETQGNKLGVIVAPNKHLEQALEEVLINTQITANTCINTQIISNVN